MKVISNNIKTYLNFKPLRMIGDSVLYRHFEAPDFIGRKWAGCTIVQKTLATQSVDHSCIFRIMRLNSRITLTVRTGGAVCLRIRSADGTVSKEVQTTAIPTIDHVLLIGYSWDLDRLSLTVWDWTDGTLVESVSTTATTAMANWVEVDGLYIGNREDRSIPYSGNIYGGCFGMDIAYNTNEMENELSTGNTCLGRDFLLHPQVMGYSNTDYLREPNNLSLTADVPYLPHMWGTEDLYFYPDTPLASIPKDSVVYDTTDEVVKIKKLCLDNKGVDYVDFGRPELWLDLFYNHDFTFEVLVSLNSLINPNYIFVNRDLGDIKSSLISIYFTENRLDVVIFGIRSEIYLSNILDRFIKVTVSKIGNKFYVFADGISVVSSVLPSTFSYQTTTNFYLGSRTDGLTYNPDLKLLNMRIWQGANVDGSTTGLTLVTNFPMQEPAGGTQIVDTISNVVGNSVDGSPLGYIGAPCLVPLSLLG